MKYWLVVVQWMVLATAMAAPATAPKPAPPGNRFLFVLETSAGMSRLEHGGRQAIFDLIYSGVDGRMRKGDTYGIWTFNEQVFAGVYPMQVWDGQRNLEHAASAGRYLKAQRYEKEGTSTNLINQLQAVLRVAKDLSVFIVTDGDTLVKGTPFDDEINAAYRASAVQVRYTSKPLITTLTARNGQFTSALVTLAGDKIVLAHLPPQTNATVEVAKAPPAPATNEIASAPPKPIGKVISISDLEAAAKAEREKATNTSALKIATEVAQSNDGPVAIEARRVVVAIKTNALPATNVVEQPVIVVPPPVSVTPSNVAAAPRPANAAASVARAPVAVTNDTPSKPEPLPAFVPAQIEVSARTTTDAPRGSMLTGKVMLIFGGVFVGASVLGGVMFMRRMRRPKHPSFISQGMDRS